MNRLDVFVAPKPSLPLIRFMTLVNRLVMLHGIPCLRDLNPFNRLAGLRGVSNVRYVDFPGDHQDRLISVCGAGKATFFVPNHPEFFTDWMIDKEILSRVSPLAACWATHGVVNGLGRMMQRFWLANNLIAQIPGNSDAAREYSIDWATKGHGVLLHPEGGVGWHGEFIAPLMPGAVDMGIEALRRGRIGDQTFEAWVAPVVWKLNFLEDVGSALASECGYVEARLTIERDPADDLPGRVYRIYSRLLSRDESSIGLSTDEGEAYFDRQERVVAALVRRLRERLQLAETDVTILLGSARRWLRNNRKDIQHKEVQKLVETITRVRRVGIWAGSKPRITQEEIAEHIKRLRNDYCKGTLRDTMNAYVPQPAGPRRAHIRVPEPLALHMWQGTADEALAELRTRMQKEVDGIVATLSASGRFISYSNPFYRR